MGEGSVMMGFDQVYVVTKTHAMRLVLSCRRPLHRPH